MILGQVIVLSHEQAAAHILSPDAVREFQNSMALADRKGDSFRAGILAATFGTGTLAAIMPPSASVALALAEAYDGMHAENVRRMAARIAAGLLAADPGPDSGPVDGQGGQRAKLPPKVPRKPRPGGAAVAIPATGVTKP